MGVSTLERQITEIEQTRPATLPAIDWNEVDRLGIKEVTQDMTSHGTLQKHVAVRRDLINWVDGMLRNQRENGMDSHDRPYSNLLDRRRELSQAQRIDRLRLAGRR